jgi:hypothetical protein
MHHASKQLYYELDFDVRLDARTRKGCVNIYFIDIWKHQQVLNKN